MNRRVSGEASIDREQHFAFMFNGRRYQGHAGDTLASALLANGVRLVGRSFKLHRPRGIFSAGVEEPNGFLTVGEGPYRDVNMRATEIALYDGLVAHSQNCWPTVELDCGAALGWFARWLPAGFYHKTFQWPAWNWYEGALRRLAGLGRLDDTPDPDRYAARHHHCDVLVVGAGPAGLAAAAAAAAQGEDVVLLDGGELFGGSLLAGQADIDGVSARRWAADRAQSLAALPRVLLLPRTTALGYFDGNLVSAVERIQGGPGPRQRLWKIRAGRVVLATGAIERPLVFTNNDRPGIMLASAVRTYVRQYAVSPGSCAAVFTNNDSAYDTAFALHEQGVKVAAIVDVRRRPGAEVAERARRAGIALHAGCAVVDTRGAKSLRSVRIADFDADSGRLAPRPLRTLRCDLLCTSGGWNPVVHLYSQAGGKLRYDAEIASFVPGGEACAQQVECVGAAGGHFDLGRCLEDGHRAGVAGASGGIAAVGAPRAAAQPAQAPLHATWRIPGWGRRDRRHHQWVDLAHDVTVCDIELAAGEGFRSVEHMKRYTSCGMAADQGKSSNVSALAILGEATGRAPGAVGTTTFRPPYHSVAIGTLAGTRVDELAQRFRRLPVAHESQGGAMEDHGGWLRPACYRRAGETEAQAIDREARTARSAAVLSDSSSLGKIEVCGPDAAEFLNRLYVNNVMTLRPGCLRYVLMLNDNGVIIDDGVLACLSEGRYLVNTSSAGALDMHFWMEEWLQCEWRPLRVWIAQQTAQWATLTISGPRARAVLGRLELPIDLGGDAFPHMRLVEAQFEGSAVRVRRASFTGELSFELDVAADRAQACWERLMDLGEMHGITPLGMEALDVLRVEKGFLEVGVDTDGDTSPLDVGWATAIGKKPGDFIGRRSLQRAAMQSAGRLQLVGLLPGDPGLSLPVGTHALTATGDIDGHVTSSCMSPHLGHSVALARVSSGLARKGETVTLDIEGRRHVARIVDTSFFDPDGERLRV